ncbi:tetratricopeptide repeat protein [Halomonas mongoliensis]|uniref:Tetratricopeptide repeat protein n=1 Tax=Halomonas mongoliensis TaxID=321265 RepID=A0ABU1GS65_9GAMM|nr:tetratricopeptide repeat protein [Halomonas mongoliensis]MDR5894411.1 tetratricopeptide repeat protein [Halomonas mongoliensis]
MIKVAIVAILLVLSPLAQAEILFQDEDVWDAFVGQDFDANLVKAEEGDARAQYLIGRAYLFGLEEQGVSVDQEKGLCWMKAAADQGAAEAYYALGVLYRRGIGVDKDAGKWEEYMTEAGEQWLRPAMTDLLDTYRDGDPQIGIDQDEEKYLYWLEKTAEDGLAISMRNMARRYRQGRGFEVDLEKAFGWIMQAVELDDLSAQEMAGEYYEKGMVVEQDLVKAYMMYDLSGTVPSTRRDELAERMTDEQIKEAIARSWQWQLEHGKIRPASNGYRYQPDVSGLEPLSLTPESDQ